MLTGRMRSAKCLFENSILKDHPLIWIIAFLQEATHPGGNAGPPLVEPGRLHVEETREGPLHNQQNPGGLNIMTSLPSFCIWRHGYWYSHEVYLEVQLPFLY